MINKIEKKKKVRKGCFLGAFAMMMNCHGINDADACPRAGCTNT